MFDPSEPLGAIDDEWPRLIFTRGPPALAMETRVALTPCMVGGADRGQDRVGLPCAGNHHGTADHPREGQDQGGSHPVSGATKDLLGPMRIATPFIRGAISIAYPLRPSAPQLTDSEDKYGGVRSACPAESIRQAQVSGGPGATQIRALYPRVHDTMWAPIDLVGFERAEVLEAGEQAGSLPYQGRL